MVLRPDVVRERLAALGGYVLRLREVARTPRDEFIADWRATWLAERGLQLAAEAVFDVANHVLAGALNEQATDHEDSLKRLAARGILSAGLGERLRGLGGLRNVLVHRYLEIDPGRVFDHVEKALRDFPDFISEIETYLARP